MSTPKVHVVHEPEAQAKVRPLLYKKTMTPREAAEYCGFGLAATYKLLAENIMPHIRVGNRYYIPTAAVDRWLESEPFVQVGKIALIDERK